MQTMLQDFMQILAVTAEASAAVVILTGMAQALWVHFEQVFRGGQGRRGEAGGRLRLGYALSLALELLIGADILKSAVSPSWADLGQLGAIVGIRTVLNYFLLYEMRMLTREQGREES